MEARNALKQRENKKTQKANKPSTAKPVKNGHSQKDQNWF